MKPTAFGSRRVTESLRSIAQYLDDAAQIAAGVSPGSEVQPNLVAIPRNPGPRLTSVIWDASAKRVITLPPGNPTTLTVRVTGSGLGDVNTFKLVSRGTDIVAANLQHDVINPDTILTAEFDDVPSESASYDAFVIDDANQTFLRPNALFVEVQEQQTPLPTPTQPAPPQPAPPQPTPPGVLQLVAMIPNECDDGTTELHTLVFIDGRGGMDLNITDAGGNVLKDWRVEHSNEHAARTAKQSAAPTKVSLQTYGPGASASYRWLSIHKPEYAVRKGEAEREFYLRLQPADSSLPSSSLPFRVLQRRSASAATSAQP